jgi:outer membrane protein assembly factor BamB
MNHGWITSHGPVLGSNGIGYYGAWTNFLVFKFSMETGDLLGSFNTLQYNLSSGAITEDESAFFIHAPKSPQINHPGRMFRIDAATMDYDWFFQTNAGNASFVESTSPRLGPDGDVLFGNRSGVFWRLHRLTGLPVWTHTGLHDVRRTAVMTRDDTKVVVANVNRVTALSYDTGAHVWTTDIGSEIGTPATAPDGTIVFGAQSGTIYGLDPANGSIRWTRATLGAITAAPAFSSDGVAYVCSSDHRMYAIRTSDGVRLWSYTGSHQNPSPPVVGHDGRIYFFDRGGWLHCVAPDGTAIWTRATGGESRGPMSIDANGTLYVGTNKDGMPMAIIRQTGAQLPFERLIIGVGQLVSGGAAQMGASDDNYAVIQDGTATLRLRSTPQVRAEIELNSTYSNLTKLGLRFEASADPGSSATQTLEMFNWSTNSYEVVDQRPASTTDMTVNVQLTGNVNRFLQPNTRLVRVRCNWWSTPQPGPWQVRIDHAKLIDIVPEWMP